MARTAIWASRYKRGSVNFVVLLATGHPCESDSLDEREPVAAFS